MVLWMFFIIIEKYLIIVSSLKFLWLIVAIIKLWVLSYQGVSEKSSEKIVRH